VSQRWALRQHSRNPLCPCYFFPPHNTRQISKICSNPLSIQFSQFLVPMQRRINDEDQRESQVQMESDVEKKRHQLRVPPPKWHMMHTST
jgi:hypothetical protein